MPLTAEWQFVATLSVDRVPVPGNWDGVDGGDTTSDTRSYRAGGHVEPEAIPAAPTTGDVILERAYRGDRDGVERKRLAGLIGHEATVNVVVMANDRRDIGDTRESIDGVIKEVTRPQFRSEGDGVATYRVVVTPTGHWE